MKQELDGTFQRPARADLHVVVAANAPRLRALVERQPGVVRTSQSATATQYRLAALHVGTAGAAGRWWAKSAQASCPPARVLSTCFDEIWICEPQMGTESITFELGGRAVKGVRLTLGRRWRFHAR